MKNCNLKVVIQSILLSRLSENKIADPTDELKKIIQSNADYYITHPRDSKKNSKYK